MSAKQLGPIDLRRQRRHTRMALRRTYGVNRPRGAVLATMSLLSAATAAGAVVLALPIALPRASEPAAVRAARRLNRAAGTLAAAVLFDSAIEHYRGAFKNRAMYTPLAVASLSLLGSLHGHNDRAPAAHLFRDTTFSLAGLTGVVGTAFHIYNVGKKPGGFCTQNLFYGAPLGAPAALILSGMLGFLAERARDNLPGTPPTIFGLEADRVIATATGVGLFGTVGEAGLLHFRGAFHNPAMLLPVTLPPIAGAMIVRTAFLPPGQHKLTAWWLRVTALLGAMGSLFHIAGVARAMGGWRNWQQNVLDGPPIPAPPAFTGLALAGLAALGLQGDHVND